MATKQMKKRPKKITRPAKTGTVVALGSLVPERLRKVIAVLAGRARHDVIIHNHPTIPNKFVADPIWLPLLLGEGPHEVRFWNFSASATVEVRFVENPLGGRVDMLIASGDHEDVTIDTQHMRGRFPYKIKAAGEEQEATPPGVMFVRSAGDAEIIID